MSLWYSLLAVTKGRSEGRGGENGKERSLKRSQKVFID